MPVVPSSPSPNQSTRSLTHGPKELGVLSVQRGGGSWPPLKYHHSALRSILSAFARSLSLCFFHSLLFSLFPLLEKLSRCSRNAADDERSIYIAANRRFIASRISTPEVSLSGDGAGGGSSRRVDSCSRDQLSNLVARFRSGPVAFQGPADVFNVIAFYGGMLNP